MGIGASGRDLADTDTYTAMMPNDNKGESMVVNTEEPLYPHGLESLAAQAETFFKECKPKAYRQMKKDGSLLEVCQLRAKAATNFANDMILQGMMPNRAWDIAIRSVILESESD